MTDSQILERRYQRILAFYPREFREEREQEILAVLMAGAAEGQRWPNPAEMGDILHRAIPMRMRDRWMRARARESLQARVIGPVPVIAGVVLAYTTISCVLHHWWGLSVVPVAAIPLFAARLTGRNGGVS